MAILSVDSLTGCNSIPDFFQGTANNASNPTKTIIHNSTTPTSWTKDTSHNDKALRVIGGAEGTALAPGGTSPFTSVFSSSKIYSSGPALQVIAPVGPSNSTTVTTTSTSTGNVANRSATSVTLSSTQWAPHTHTYSSYNAGFVLSGRNIAPLSARVSQSQTPRTSGTPAATVTTHNHNVSIPHTHTINSFSHNHTLTTGQHSHPSSSISANFQILYADIIIAIKN